MQNNCLNFIVCKQFKYNNQHEFCSDCFLYFNKEILLNKNIEKNQCPLCLEDSEELNMYKLDQCNHSICQSCLYNIYFDLQTNSILLESISIFQGLLYY